MDNKFNLLDRRESDAQTPTLVISAVTNEKFQSVMSKFGIVSIDETDDVPDIPQEFLVFDWHNNAENDKIPDALNHLQTELKKFGCFFGRGGYKILDVHSNKSFLNFHDKKIGKVSGTSDLAIVPYKTAKSGAMFQTVALVELKSEMNVQKAEGLYSFSSQAKLELIASWCLSHQRVLVVLTDLVSGAIVFELSYDPRNESFGLIEYRVSLSQMAFLVTTYLTTKVKPDASYLPIDDDEFSIPKLVFKRTKLSHEDNIAWENFKDYGSMLPPGSIERCQLVAQLMSSFESHHPPMSNYSHMYM